jgi:hypothetical protein
MELNNMRFQITGDDESGIISLTSLQVFARDVRILLQNGLQVYVSDFERVYNDRFGVELKPALFGHTSVEVQRLVFSRLYLQIMC